jgi:hypothetical protein
MCTSSKNFNLAICLGFRKPFGTMSTAQTAGNASSSSAMQIDNEVNSSSQSGAERKQDSNLPEIEEAASYEELAGVAPPVPKDKDKEAEESDDTRCAVCFIAEAETDNQIVICSGCELAVHQDCYAIHTIPEGDWYCTPCQARLKDPSMPHTKDCMF